MRGVSCLHTIYGDVWFERHTVPLSCDITWTELYPFLACMVTVTNSVKLKPLHIFVPLIIPM